jgi:histidine triad (HIT) family protein
MRKSSEQESAITECEFCQIASGKLSARVIHETATTLAFFPLKPAVLGHTLVIPKSHVPDFLQLTDVGLAADLAAEIVEVGRALQRALKPEGMNAITSAGEAASQTIFHLHVHLVPRRHGDAMGNIWPQSEPLPEALVDSVAEAVRPEFS